MAKNDLRSVLNYFRGDSRNFGLVPDRGISTQYALEDHKHGLENPTIFRVIPLISGNSFLIKQVANLIFYEGAIIVDALSASTNIALIPIEVRPLNITDPIYFPVMVFPNVGSATLSRVRITSTGHLQNVSSFAGINNAIHWFNIKYFIDS